ncbi:MAG: threonine--tRNA ligase [Candidatus Nomurabacteria bacterium]|jgi:threonyl-tRNA synthetase|nr:threonine--tRNA ligase [Candidatus Nomurabacteria bacterium]
MNNPEYVEKMRHSLAHIMAAAIQSIWPTTKFGIGPAVEDGFYYDVDLGDTTVSDADFGKIEQAMRAIIKQNLPITCSEVSLNEAKKWAKDGGQPYKLELIEELADQTITFYEVGDFKDLCRGPHVDKTGDVGKFKLLRVAGAYWRGDETRPQMQRIYGLAYATQEELGTRLTQLEEAKKRDHRKLGKELDLFTFSDLVGAGLPMFTPRGTVLRDTLAAYSKELREAHGFEQVWTPHITKVELYKKSGHWDKFGEELFLVTSQVTGDQFALKPMNCPHHTQIYCSQPRSYRDLPVRYMEVTTDYRDEKTGELGGLGRVRSLTQDDSHIFCRDDQIEAEIQSLLDVANEMYSTIDMKLRVRLSYRDGSDTYLGDAKLWDSAQKQLKKAVAAANLDYYEQDGEAAFYGPKIDFMATDAIGREHQVATVQLDLVQPGRFELEYVDDDGQKKTPVMIHCAILGSIERFLSVFIEHTAGRFPIWCAPEQLRIIKVKDSPELDKFVAETRALAAERSVRAAVDDSNNSVGKKIRSAEIFKVPYAVVVGEKEVESGKLPLRIRADLVVDGSEPREYTPEQLIKSIANETHGRVSKSSL